MKLKRNKSLLTLVAIIVIMLIYLFYQPFHNWINDMSSIIGRVDVDEVKIYIRSFGIYAPLISFCLMILQSIIAPLPAFIITFANAAVFGWIKGALLSWSSAMAGASLCFFIARFLGREGVSKLTSRLALDSVDEFFEKYGRSAVLIARLLPFISFDIVSYAAGLTSMGFWPFFIATGIGQLPATIIYSYVGGMLTGGVKTMVFGLSILLALSILIFLIKKAWFDRKRNL